MAKQLCFVVLPSTGSEEASFIKNLYEKIITVSLTTIQDFLRVRVDLKVAPSCSGLLLEFFVISYSLAAASTAIGLTSIWTNKHQPLESG